MQNPSREQIAANVRDAKQAAGVSDAQIAEVIGTSRAAANERVNGHTNFRIDELVKLAPFLNTTLEDLLAQTAEVSA